MVRSGMDAFDIVILGFDRAGPDSPAAGLQRVFPIDQGTALRLLNALPATVKRRVPQATAEQYRSALVAIGARVELRKAESAPAAQPLPTPADAAPKPPVAATVRVDAASSAAPRAAVAATMIAPPRFAGAGTLKQGSPIAAAAPVTSAASFNDVAYLPTDRPPAPEPLIPAVVFQDAAAAPLAVPSSSEKWGGLVSAPKADALAGTMVATSPGGEREENRRELMRRLMDPAEADDRSAAEAAGGISMLELDLPSPRAGWAASAGVPTAAETASGPHGFALNDGVAGQLSTIELAPPTPVPRVQVIAPPPDRRSFIEALPDAIALSLREGGARWVLLGGVVALVGSGLLWLLRRQPTLATCTGLLGATVLLALASEQTMATLRAVVDDLGSPDGPDLRATDIGRYFNAGFNLLCFGLATQLPFLSWLSSHRAQLPGAFLHEPLGLVMFSVGASYWPMAVGLQAITENPTAVWSLPRGIRAILIAPADYLMLVLATAIVGLLPVALTLLLVRMGLPSEILFLGFGLGLSLSHGAIGALIGHIGRLHPRVFSED